MDATFWLVLSGGTALVAAQGAAAWADGYFSRRQVRARSGSRGFSFLEHGGMWADLLLISPIAAYLASTYDLAYFSPLGLAALGTAVAAALLMLVVYRREGVRTPGPHAHSGRTTFAGWIHLLYVVGAIWICFLGYVNPATASGSVAAITLLLTLFFYVGVMKFRPRRVLRALPRRQVALEIAGLWFLTLTRAWFV